MKKYFNLLVFALCFMVLIPIVEAADDMGITADAAILINAGTGEALYTKNPDKQEYPASVTKILTCIMALESGQGDRSIVVSPNAANVECTRLNGGEVLKMNDALRQMMMVSDNGCALAVGEALGGSTENFADMMNAKAKKIGVTHSHFVNPNGMPDVNHYTTARDMAKIAAYCMKNPQFRQIVGTKERNIYYIRPAGRREFCENTNDLLYDYAGCTGGKTGWTNAARGCLMVAAKRKGVELIAVVFHSSDEDTSFSDAAALLDYSFNHLS